jgi:hypothetical protein
MGLKYDGNITAKDFLSLNIIWVRAAGMMAFFRLPEDYGTYPDP